MSNSTVTSSFGSTTSFSSIPTTESTESTPSTASSSAVLTTSEGSTSVSTASAPPPSTVVVTSVVSESSNGQTSPSQVTVIRTFTSAPSSTPEETSRTATSSGLTSSTSTALATSSNNGGGSGGLSTGGKVAIAVVIPVVVVAVLVLAGILLWRRRKQNKENEEKRRKEVEDYTYNPNNDPTMPVVASEGSEMAEDNSGYRGWGGTTVAASSNRKASTTLSGGQQPRFSDSGSNALHQSPGSSGGNTDGYSIDPLMNKRETMGSDELAAMGAGAGMLHSERNQPMVRRDPSNASSRYSTGAHSSGSDEQPPMPPVGQAYDYNPNVGYGFSQHGPYGDGTYGGGMYDNAGMPVVRDVSARRNTQIKQPGQYQQGNSGIAQNF